MGTKTEEIRPRAYKAVEGFTFRPGDYRVVRVRRWQEDGGGLKWAVEWNGVFVGKWYRTRDEAVLGVVEHARETRFSLRSDGDDHRYEWGRVREAGAINQKMREALRSGAAIVREKEIPS